MATTGTATSTSTEEPITPSTAASPSPSVAEQGLRLRQRPSSPLREWHSEASSYEGEQEAVPIPHNLPRAPTRRPTVISKCSWALGSQLGQGSYGTVFKALDKESGLSFAVKKVELAATGSAVQRELDICKDLRHPNIVSVLGHHCTDAHLFIYMEYVSGGSLTSVLKEFGCLSGPLVKKATRGMVEGLDYLHTRNPPVVHRDIKGGNVLVGLDFTVKLADFGCSKCDVNTKSFSTIGSVPWMAPEVIMGGSGHGRKADIWSLGCTVIEMVTAEKPWGNGAFDNIMQALKHIGLGANLPPIPETVEQDCRAFLELCIRRNADERRTCRELLEEPFLQLEGTGSIAGDVECAA